MVADALREMQREREAVLSRERREQEQALADLEEKARRELDSVGEQREALHKKIAKQNAELASLDQQATEEWRRAQQEQEQDAAARRIIELAGNDNESIRNRLLTEGFQESMVLDSLRRRTLEQTMERPTGLPARFVERDQENALERLTREQVKAEDLRQKDVIYAMKDLREQAALKGYLSSEERDRVDRALYFSEKFQENDFYKKQDEHGYMTQIHDLASGIRRDLGLESTTSTLTYNRR